MHIATKQ